MSWAGFSPQCSSTGKFFCRLVTDQTKKYNILYFNKKCTRLYKIIIFIGKFIISPDILITHMTKAIFEILNVVLLKHKKCPNKAS